jgi:V/A-type H+-transporting ATPase subunit G/H
MARDDILSRIKQAEAEAKAGVQKALEDKDRKITAAAVEAENQIKAAEVEAQDFYEKSYSNAQSEIRSKKESILQGGMKNVSSLSSSAGAKLDKAVEHLTKEFMGLLHA